MKRVLFIGCLLGLVSGALAIKEYRDFTDTQGRIIRGAVVSYDEVKEIVTIERDNRKTAKAPISMFCDADQAYIRAWEISRVFQTKSQFRISAEKHDVRNKQAGAQLTARNQGLVIKVEDTHYEIFIENRSASALNVLTIDYCIFYEQDHPSGQNKGVLYAHSEISSMGPKSKKTLLTDAVSTYKSDLAAGYEYSSGARSLHTGDVDGIWIRVYMETGGIKSMREFSFPKGLSDKRSWRTKSIPAGINE